MNVVDDALVPPTIKEVVSLNKDQKDIKICNMQLSCIIIQAQSLITLCERTISKGTDQLSREAIKESADYLASIAALYEKEVPSDPQKRLSLTKQIERLSEDIGKSATFKLLRDILGAI